MVKKNLLIIIPARSGSKSIKNKNMLKIFKKPLISYSFLISKKIKEKSKIIHCSTDSKKIQLYAIKNHINAKPLRPKKFSKDFSLDIEFVNHTLDVYNKKNTLFNIGLILRPTNPVRSSKMLNVIYKFFKRNKSADSLKSIYPSRKSPFKSWIKSGNLLKSVASLKNQRESFNSPRQKLPLTYDQTGTYEFFKINYKKKIKTISGKKITFYDIPEKESLDIDNLQDLKLAETYLKKVY